MTATTATARTQTHGLHIDTGLYNLVRNDVLPGTGVEPEAFFAGLAGIVEKFAPRNAKLLSERDALQAQLDDWYAARKGQPIGGAEQQAFLESIGYLVKAPADVQAVVSNVDAEIATTAGPQLVVPVDNARYALNAANARWGSLYNALYGTNVISEDGGATRAGDYNPKRGEKVVAYAASVLDKAAPLARGSHADATRYLLDGNSLAVMLSDDRTAQLADPEQFVGYTADDKGALTAVVLRNNGLHLVIDIDASTPIGAAHAAGMKDVTVESALTTIMDCEDSVAAVDAQDKLGVYGNWLGIMKGTLTASLKKGSGTIERRLDADRSYTAARNSAPLILAGRSVLLVRNVGLHMYTDAVTTADGAEIPEGLLDAMVTVACAKHDLLGRGEHGVRNSRTGSVYVVKPKMHGPHEVAFACEVFDAVEQALGLDKDTVKIGIMDEERRTSVNLRACIAAASTRVMFINTGFLDRTGDEIHSIMTAGAVIPKAEMKGAKWLGAYEDNNVDVGLGCGLKGVAQIGKGMWAAPDAMADMMVQKIGHPKAGANTAWVPSPTAATLHALHYHEVSVADRQNDIAKRDAAALSDILELPVMHGRNLSEEEIQNELDNNAQSILGYVVRWIQQGIGCSKVQDINNVALMEDRATLRISSQHMANWLHHGVITKAQVHATFEKMAKVVDGQNVGDPHYHDMAPDFAKSVAYAAALDLVLKGREEANGYTEPTLHARRREFKAGIAA